MSDLISREEVVKEIRKRKIESDMPTYWYRGMETAQEIIKSFPSADIEEDVARRIATIIENEQDMRVILKNAEPKTGGWIEVTNGRGGHECSECHSYAPSYASGDEHLSNYCPNCGAKMGGESDG